MKCSLSVIIVLLVFTSCVSRQKKDSPGMSKPDIVFILTDDQAWNVLSKDGRYQFMETPNLDQLSEEGLVFENAFVTTSLCSPSRACFLTGSYAHTHGVYVNSYSDPDPDVPFLPRVLQEAGYETAFIGKWHMKRGAEPREGFDYWLSFDGQGKYTDPDLNENGRDFIEEGYMTDILTDYAVRWMEKPRKKPYCLFLWHKAVHAPFTPAPRDSAAFPDAMIPEYDNWYDDMEDKPEWMRRGWVYGVHNKLWHDSEGKPVPGKVDPNPWDPKNPKVMNYLRAMLAVDESYGRIRNTLEGLNALDNTIIVFGSDNGFFLGAHQRGDKRLMYEESLRIPLIIRYPGIIEAGSRNTDFVLSIDVAPTLIELAGAEVPGEMQGASLVPLLKNESVEWRESLLYEYFQEAYAPGFVTVSGVRNKRYKYIESPNLPHDINELYDLENDPGEMDNLINSPEYQTIKSEMIKEMERLKAETGYFDPGVYHDESN
ncbi:MAG: sulfatase [Bacteroidetes bacterium]|nr:sulfatase [Bacteroidota bacterium]